MLEFINANVDINTSNSVSVNFYVSILVVGSNILILLGFYWYYAFIALQVRPIEWKKNLAQPSCTRKAGFLKLLKQQFSFSLIPYTFLSFFILQSQFSLIDWDNNFNNFHFLSNTNIANFSVPQKSIYILPAFENYPPIVGILFPVPQIMIHQLRGILFSIPQEIFYLFIYASVWK